MKEYSDFLATQPPPYDSLTAGQLARLLADLEIEYFVAGAVVVQAGSEPLRHFWVVRSGLVEVVDRDRVLDQLGPGDTFGHVSVLSGLPPALSVRAVEDTLCLRLPDPRMALGDLGRLQFTLLGGIGSRARLTRPTTLDHTPSSARSLMRPLVIAKAEDPIAIVARRVTDADESAAVVHSEDGWGVVTDHDFRGRVATGELDPSSPVRDLAIFPMITISEDFSQAAAFSRMVAQGVHHLVVADTNGTPLGMVRAADFASVEIRNPLEVRASIDDAASLDELRAAAQLVKPSLIELGQSGMPATQIGIVHAGIIDALLRKVIALHEAGHGGPFDSWLVLGSFARREPLPHSDLDTALVLQETPNGDLRRAEAVLRDMESCGIQRCKQGANATNPLFARSATEWSEATSRWLSDPSGPQALLLSSIVIDSRPVTEVPLGKSVSEPISRRRPNIEFLGAYLREAIAVRPPVGFVRDFVVDHGGRHRGQLDLKSGGLLPIAALGRWIAMASGDARGSTLDRIRRGNQCGLLTGDEADALSAAFHQVYELLIRRDLRSLSRGEAQTTYLNPRELDSLTRRQLRETFRTVAIIQDSIGSGWAGRIGQ